MASKREEKVAFEKLKKMYPGRNVQLSCVNSSWYDRPMYDIYIGDGPGKGGISTCGTTCYTIKEVMELAIKKEAEANL